jgi:sulfatase modifying factor 1
MPMSDLPASADVLGAQAPGAPPAGNMVWIPGGTFTMGSDQHYAEEAPTHKVTVGGFWMSRCAVTNTEFEKFVDATGHVTLAERPADPAQYPGAKAEMLAPSSVMFEKAAGPVDRITSCRARCTTPPRSRAM